MSFLTSIYFLYFILDLGACAEAPRAVVARPRFSFEKVFVGQLVEREFAVRNEGSAPLEIQRVSMTYPLRATSMTRRIDPGQTGRIHVELDTSGLLGLFEGKIVLFSNDPLSPEILLQFEGRVISKIEVVPRPAFFLGSRWGETSQASVEIINHELEPLCIEKVEHTSDRFWTTLETLEEGRRFRLTVTMQGEGPPGRRTESILLKTSSRSNPIVKITANTVIVQRVYIFPDVVDLGAIPLSAIRKDPEFLTKAAQTLMVTQVGGKDFQISLSTDVPGLSLKAECGPAEGRHQITVALENKAAKAGLIKGSITIRTNDPEFPVLTVPVIGFILGP